MLFRFFANENAIWETDIAARVPFGIVDVLAIEPRTDCGEVAGELPCWYICETETGPAILRSEDLWEDVNNGHLRLDSESVAHDWSTGFEPCLQHLDEALTAESSSGCEYELSLAS